LKSKLSDVNKENRELKLILIKMVNDFNSVKEDISKKETFIGDLLHKIEIMNEEKSNDKYIGNEYITNEELVTMNEELNERLKYKRELINELSNKIEFLQKNSDSYNNEQIIELQDSVYRLKEKTKDMKNKIEKLNITIEEKNDIILNLEDKIENINNLILNKEEVIAEKMEEIDKERDYIEELELKLKNSCDKNSPQRENDEIDKKWTLNRLLNEEKLIEIFLPTELKIRDSPNRQNAIEEKTTLINELNRNIEKMTSELKRKEELYSNSLKTIEDLNTKIDSSKKIDNTNENLNETVDKETDETSKSFPKKRKLNNNEDWQSHKKRRFL